MDVPQCVPDGQPPWINLKTWAVQIFVANTLELKGFDIKGNDLFLRGEGAYKCGSETIGQCCSDYDLTHQETKFGCYSSGVRFISPTVLEKQNFFSFVNAEPLIDRPSYNETSISFESLRIYWIHMQEDQLEWGAIVSSWIPEGKMLFVFELYFYSFHLLMHDDEELLPKIYDFTNKDLILRTASNNHKEQKLSKTITFRQNWWNYWNHHILQYTSFSNQHQIFVFLRSQFLIDLVIDEFFVQIHYTGELTSRTFFKVGHFISTSIAYFWLLYSIFGCRCNIFDV
jgi:hypothetical protein